MGDKEVRIDSVADAVFEHCDTALPGNAGRVVFTNVPVGDYKVTLEDVSGTREMRVEVRGATEVRFDGALLNALRVMKDCGGDELKLGDLIVGCDGRRFTDLRQLERLRWRGLTNSRLALLVRRGGAEETVSVNVDWFVRATANVGYYGTIEQVRVED
jgi:hypothetical protein